MLYQGTVDSNAMFAAAVRQINALDPLPDLVLLTGDIVDEGQPAEYAMARELLSALQVPLRIIPGNHDERSACRAAFRDHLCLPANRPFSYVDDRSGPVRIVAWTSALSPKRTAREAGDDPPANEHTPCGNADQGGSEHQRHPSQSQNSDEQHKEGDTDGPQPRNLDASSVVRAGGYPDPRRT